MTSTLQEDTVYRFMIKDSLAKDGVSHITGEYQGTEVESNGCNIHAFIKYWDIHNAVSRKLHLSLVVGVSPL